MSGWTLTVPPRPVPPRPTVDVDLSNVTARQWSRNVFGAYLVDDSRVGLGGLFLGVVTGERCDVIAWGKSVAWRRANGGAATETVPKIVRSEHTSSPGAWHNVDGSAATPAEPKPNPVALTRQDGALDG